MIQLMITTNLLFKIYKKQLFLRIYQLGLEVFLNQVILKRRTYLIQLDRRKTKTNFNDSALSVRGVISFAANITRY